MKHDGEFAMMTTKEVEADLVRFAQQFRERLAIIFTPAEIAIYDHFMAQRNSLFASDKSGRAYWHLS